MADKLMYIFNDDTQNSVDYNLWLKRLDTQLNKLTNQIKNPQNCLSNEYYNKH